MKKTLLSLTMCMVALFANAQEPVITLTAEVDGAERTFQFGSAVEGENKISIDWGDGTIVEGATLSGIYDNWNVYATPVVGTPKGNGEIKIYATGDINYFEGVSKVDGPGITTLDVSKATELIEIYADGNKLTTIDVSMLSKLNKLLLNNNSLTEMSLTSSLTTIEVNDNKLSSFDGSELSALSTLKINGNPLGTLDVSGMPALKYLYAVNCGLTSITVGALTTPKAYISVNNNLLETLDVSEATGLENGSLFAMGNNLTEVKLPDVKVKAVNISKNKFTLATIPATANVGTLTYVPQQDMVIEDIEKAIDLSSQNNLVGFAAEAQPTVYTWHTEDGTALVAGTDYTEEAGKFTFIKEQTQKVYCTMTTEALPKFTGANIFKIVAVTVKSVDAVEPASEPVITLTAEVDGAERTFQFGSAVEGENKISIDWGDGTIVEGATLSGIYDNWNVYATPVVGTPKGNGEIKIYATGDINYFEGVSKVDGPGITTLDVSKATELIEIYADGNKLTTIDVSMLSKLNKLLLNNNSLTEMSLTSSLTTIEVNDNKLSSFDGSELSALSTLKINGNPLGTLDVSGMPALKSVYAQNCGLTSFNAGALTTAKAYISLTNNFLETLDVSEATGLENGYLVVENNNLTEIKYPNVKYNTFKVANNKLTFATVPAAVETKKASNFVNAPQQDMEIEDIDGTIDLSSQSVVGTGEEAKATVYAWYTEDGTALVAGTDYTEEAGKFTFIKKQTQKVYCTMTNEALPQFTGANIFKTVAVTVKSVDTGIDNVEAAEELTGDIYSVDGKLIVRNASVSTMAKGLYIVKTADGKAVKVIRK